jgi:hypothetical protein
MPEDPALRTLLRHWQPSGEPSPWLERRVWNRIAATSPSGQHAGEEVRGLALWAELWTGWARRAGLGGVLLAVCLPLTAGALTGLLQARADSPAHYVASLRANLKMTPLSMAGPRAPGPAFPPVGQPRDTPNP